MEDPERCEAIRSCRELGEPKAGTDESFLVDLEDVTDGSRAKVSNLTIGPDNIEVFRLAVQVHGVRIRDSVSNLTGRHRADGIDAAIDRLDVPGQRFIAVTRVCEDLSLIEEDCYTVGAFDEFRSVLPQEFAALLWTCTDRLTRLRDTANIAMDFPTKVGGIEEDVPTGVDFG